MMNFGLDQSIRLCHGAGNGKNSACWMTAVSVYAGKNAWKDQPECVAPTIRAFAIRLNDSSAPVEPDLSGVSRVRKVVCHA